jgi:aspartate aminotransferase-like enzyme
MFVLVDSMKLFTVGPVACYPEVLEAMAGQMYSHRSEEYLELHFDTVERLQAFIGTGDPIFLFSSTGTGFMEAAVRNCVREKLLVCVNGSFGRRFADVAEANGKEVVVLEPPLGEPISEEALDGALDDDPAIEAVAITHNETSAGLINPLEALAEVVKERGKMLFVDAVSSMGGTEIRVDDWGIDICFSSSQKCFGVPPGLGKVAGLNAALKMVDGRGGRGWYFDTFRRRNERIRGGVEDLGLSTFPKKGYESPTVSCINAPEAGGPAVYGAMRGEGFELAQGYGALKERTFRIGNMGYIEDDDIDLMLESLGRVLGKL